jgi:hypothetical protein
LRTRGAVVPVRSVRVTKEALMRGADIGSERTLYKNLRRLVAVGLVLVRSLGGEHAGSEYTVLLPEEAPPPTTPTPPTDASHKVESLPTAQSGVRGVGLIVDEQASSAEPKTFSFQTKDHDDEAFADLLCKLRAAAREVTGKDTSAAEGARWSELGELLITELKIAAARTTVSSAPAFLTEHLRRRLWKKDKAQLERESRAAAAEPTAQQGIDASNCPDCRGTGWWYPQGEEKGVAKCKHSSLKRESDQ